jgi:hypothetical protein
LLAQLPPAQLQEQKARVQQHAQEQEQEQQNEEFHEMEQAQPYSGMLKSSMIVFPSLARKIYFPTTSLSFTRLIH